MNDTTPRQAVIAVFERVRKSDLPDFAPVPEHPEWGDREPFASVARRGVECALAGGEHALPEMSATTHEGVTKGGRRCRR